jgi:uncharacterized membrane protein
MPTTSHPVTRLPNGEREAQPRGIPRLPVWQTLVGAVAASATTWVVLVPLVGLDLAVHTSGEYREVGLASVVATALVAAIAALALATALRRLAGRPRRLFLAVSAAALAGSLLGPLGAVGVGAALGLAMLHLAVATAVVPLVAGRLPERRSR